MRHDGLYQLIAKFEFLIELFIRFSIKIAQMIRTYRSRCSNEEKWYDPTKLGTLQLVILVTEVNSNSGFFSH